MELSGEEDTLFFFGREAFTQRLVERVTARDFVAVVGASGSGKSSVVRAGLVPVLRRGTNDLVWDILALVPGAEPLASLSRALDPPPATGLIAARAHLNAAAASLRTGEVTLKQLVVDYIARQPGTDRLLLVVDQFEELTTLAKDGDGKDQTRFVDLLLEATGQGGPLTVLITLRSDFYTQLVHRRDLNDRLQDGVVHIGPLSRAAPEGGLSELEMIIRRPAEAVGLDFEDGLVPRITTDVGNEPGNLPLLEYLLTELWRRRRRGLLTHEAYESLGGVHGAIARRADEAYEGLTSDQQRAARRLFLSLVHPGEGQMDTRAPALFPEDPLEVEVARHFAGPGVRLLVADEDALRGRVIEVSHEALIRSWSMLRRWIDANRETLRVRERVRVRMRRWHEEAEPEDLLLPAGLELEEGRRLLGTDTDVSIDEVRDYIVRSIAAEDACVAAQQERLDAERQHELAVQRQKRRLIGSALVVSLVLLALAGWQWWQANIERIEAVKASNRAKQQEALALAQRLATTAAKVLEENPGKTALAAMLAVESQVRRNTPESNAVLRDVLALTPLAVPLVDFPWVRAEMQISADGRVQVLENQDRRGAGLDDNKAQSWSSVQLLEDSGLSTVSVRRFAGHMQPVISPEGRWQVSAGFGRRLVVNDLTTSDVVIDEPTRGATFPVFAPDGKTLYIAMQTGIIEVRQAPSWQLKRKLRFPVEGARHTSLRVGVTSDSARLLVTQSYGSAFIVPTDGSPVTRLNLDVYKFSPPWFEPSALSYGIIGAVGHLGLTRQWHGKTEIWDLQTGTRLRVLDDEGELGSGPSVFSPNGQLFATANSNGKVFLRTVDDFVILQRWEHSENWKADDWIHALAFSADGDLLASAGEDGVIMIWDIDDGALRHQLKQDSPILALAFDPVDGTLLAGTEDGTLTRFDLRSGNVLAQQEFSGAVAEIVVGSQRRMVAIGVHETRWQAFWDDISFIDRTTGRELSHISWNGSLFEPTISPDGSRFAALAPVLNEVLVWDTATGKVVLRIPIDASPQTFSPDGQQLLLHDSFGPLLVIDAKTGATLLELGEPGGVDEVFADHHGDFAVTRGVDRSLRGWNLATGEPLWHTAAVSQVSPDGRAFAKYAKAEQKIHVFESATERRIGSIPLDKRGTMMVRDDGSRLLTTRLVSDSMGRQKQANKIELWDVRTARLIQHHQIDSRFVSSKPIDDSYIALSGPRTNEQPTSWMEVMNLDNGRVAWSLSEKWGGFYDVKFVDSARNRVLIQTPRSRQMHVLTSGQLVWQESSSFLRAAADVPGTDLIALADATTLNNNDDVIRLVERETGKEHRRMIAGGHARHVAATADGTRLIAAVEGERWRGIRIWRSEDGRLVKEIEMDANPQAILPLSDSDRVAVHDFAQNLRVFDLRNGEQVHRIAHARFANDVAYARDADRAVTIADASLRYWDTRNGQEIAHRISHGDASSVSVSPDGTRVAYLTSWPHTTDDGTEFPATVLWRPEHNDDPVILPVEDVNRIQFDPTGRFLTLLAKDKSVRLVDTKTLRTEFTVRPLRNGKFDDLSFVASSILLVRETGHYPRNDRHHSLRAFNIATGEEMARLDVGIGMLPVPGSPEVLFRDVHERWRSFDPFSVQVDPVLIEDKPDRLVAAHKSPRVLATSYWERTFVHDMANGRTLTLTTGEEPFNVLHAAIDPSGRFIALSQRERKWRDDSPGEIVIIDASNGDELARLHTQRSMWNVEFINGGDAVVVSELRSHLPKEPDHLLMHWNWRTGIKKILVQDNPVPYLAMPPYGKHFATVEGNWHPGDKGIVGTRQLRIWNVEDGAEIVRVPLDFHPSDTAFSIDGHHVAVSNQNQVLLLRATDGSQLKRFSTAGSSPSIGQDFSMGSLPSNLFRRPLGFAMQGRVLVFLEGTGAALFDIVSGHISRLRDIEEVSNLVISADGAYLALQGKGFVSVWDIAAREMLIRFDTPGLDQLTFGGESGRDLLAVRDGRIVRLRWWPEELKALACDAFATGDWRRGRDRIIGQSTLDACNSEGN